MEVENSFVFQTDSEIVQRVYRENPNYLIEYSQSSPNQEYCAIYFCSHDIYYPNVENVFRKRIIEDNYYEWYGTRVSRACKHIFVRDIFKQFYLKGVNAEINSPEKLLDFLRQESKGFKVITVGSSGGGYASILYGTQLGADQIMAFNPVFELYYFLERSSESIDPLLFRLKDTSASNCFDLRRFIDAKSDIYYFHSTKSLLDVEQSKYIHGINEVHQLSFSTAHHGIPFLKVCLSKVLNMDKNSLLRLSHKTHHPILFSIKMVGLRKTVTGLITQLYKAYKKRR